jgi:hypothetical protein
MSKNILLINSLLTIQKTSDLIEIYDNPSDLDDFWVGKILQFDHDADVILLSTYDNNGVWNGVRTLQLQEIIRFNEQSSYLSDLKKQIELVDQGALDGLVILRNKELSNLPKFTPLDHNSVLEVIKKAGLLCGLTLDCSDGSIVYGYITGIDQNVLTIDSYSRWGEVEGKSLLKISDVKSITIYHPACLFREKMIAARS